MGSSQDWPISDRGALERKFREKTRNLALKVMFPIMVEIISDHSRRQGDFFKTSTSEVESSWDSKDEQYLNGGEAKVGKNFAI